MNNRSATLRSHSPALSGKSDRAQTPQSLPPEKPVDIVDLSVDVEYEASPLEVALANVLEVMPDVTPDYARTLCERFVPELGQGASVHILNILMDDPDYPKVKSHKRKRSPEEEDGKGKAKEAKIDHGGYGSSSRPFTGGRHYNALAVELLTEEFPRIPVTYIRKIFQELKFFAPTHIRLAADSQLVRLPYKLKASPHRNKGKSRALSDEEIDKERAWLVEQLANEGLVSHAAAAQDDIVAEVTDGIECGCCFGEYAWEQMVQCPDAHLFCIVCARRAAESAIGNRKVDLCCMDQSGCKESFPISEVRRFLPAKTIDRWEAIKQDKAIQEAGIEGLESCPYCHYSVIIENEDEKLFHCRNEDCSAVSCRKCKKPEHLPKACEEAAADKKLGARHVIEEAMTAALTRQCPNCKLSFIKDGGCNIMTCPSCRTASCYLCRQPLTNHTRCQPPNANHGGEVATAARTALEKYKRENPDATDTDIDIKSIIKLYKNARTSRGAHAPAPGVRILAQHIPIPQHGLAAGHVQQALLHVQEMRAQLAVAERDARMAAAQVRPDLLLDPTGYAINFEADWGNPLAPGIPQALSIPQGPSSRNPTLHGQLNWLPGAYGIPPAPSGSGRNRD